MGGQGCAGSGFSEVDAPWVGFEDLWGGDLLFLRSPPLTTGHLSFIKLTACP